MTCFGRTTSFLVLVVGLTTLATVHGEIELYPFGENTDDMAFSKLNNISVELSLNKDFTFYGKKYSTIYINDNGVLSFVNDIRQLPFETFPIGKKGLYEYILIAPFMMNIDVSVAGNIYYRQTTADGVLQQASAQIGQYFVKFTDFRPNNVLVVTWDQVGFFGSEVGSDVTNTFQCVVASDSINTFVFFLYDNIAWTSDVGNTGNAQTGIGTVQPVVGFNKGDGKISETIDFDDYVNGALDLPTVSNMDPPIDLGLFLYHVSGSSVDYPQCKATEPVQIYPTRAGMLGGIELTFGGICFRDTDIIVARFAEGDTVPCSFVSNFKASCVMPRVDVIGDIAVTLSVDDGDNWKPEAMLNIMPFSSQPASVLRTDPFGDQWFQVKEDLTITWDRKELDTDLVTIAILSYREENSTEGSAGQQWVETQLVANVTNSGQYVIVPAVNSDIDQTNGLGFIRIYATSNPTGRTLTSDLHFLGYLLSDPGYQEDPESWSNDYCRTWYTADQAKPPFVQDLPTCPCRLDQALSDKARFQASPTCDMTQQTKESIKKMDYCFARPDIKHCVLGFFDNSPADSECCYDATGNLVYAQDSIHGSFSNRISRFQGAVPGLSGAATDLLPYMFCIVVGDDKDNLYQAARPTKDCIDYQPVRPAMVFGDPHFATFDNTSFTFNGLGEYVLLKTTDATFLRPFRLEGRFEKVFNSNGEKAAATSLTALAVQEMEDIENSFQVERNDITKLSLKLSATGKIQDLGSNLYVQFKNSIVFLPGNAGNGVINKMMIVYTLSQIGVFVTANENSMMAMVLMPNEYEGHGILEGLFGGWDEGHDHNLLTPDGKEISVESSAKKIYEEFGQTWEAVSRNLFVYDSGMDHSTYQDNEFAPVFDPVGTIPEKDLEKVCGECGVCRFDYKVTSMPEFARQTVNDAMAMAKSMNASVQFPMCPFLPAPARGVKSFVGATNHGPGSKLLFKCDEGYIFLGESPRVCQEDSTWSDQSVPTCIVVKCGSLAPPDYGTIVVTVKDGVVTATYTCEEGDPLNGNEVRECGSDDKWTGTEVKCKGGDPQGGDDNTVVIVVVVVIVLIVVIVGVVLGVYYYKKKKSSDSKEVTRPEGSAYEKVETTITDRGDVEMGTKASGAEVEPKESKPSEDDDGGFTDMDKDKDLS